MEVGAVKQAFNNEVILLKKNLNQAKIHVIHKLTRKAKTLTEKKAPEHLKEKLKRKAESAVNEVLIIKKIKPREIAKFIITHKGEVNGYINRPNVDIEKGCARLVLHKSLQDKYKFIRNRFGDVPIKDLFMSRQERRKLKKEAREQQKNKKKGKQGKVVNNAGDWDVEDINMGDGKDISQNDVDSDDERSHSNSDHSDAEGNERSGDENDSEIDATVNQIDENINSQSDGNSNDDDGDHNDQVQSDVDEENKESDSAEENIANIVQLIPEASKNFVKPQQSKHIDLGIIEKTKVDTSKPKTQLKNRADVGNKQTDTKVKENKNKNLKEKLQNRQFKKDKDESQIEGKKVVDPFFITATGGNYLSLAEPRQPDEVKEIHRQGNRQVRRAAMFGHVAKYKPRRDNFERNNVRPSKFGQDAYGNGSDFRNNNDRFKSGVGFNDKSNKFNDRNAKLNDKFNGRNSKFNDSRNLNVQTDKKEEKLHPSWEAKKKMKSMSLLPAQGKKIVFNDD